MSKKKSHINNPINVYLHFIRNFSIGLLLIGGSLYIGMLGYHVFEKMDWVDSFLNASMILSGMGPADTMNTMEGKIFAGCYALFSGLAFIAIVVVILSPMIHRFFHKIHFELGKTKE